MTSIHAVTLGNCILYELEYPTHLYTLNLTNCICELTFISVDVTWEAVLWIVYMRVKVREEGGKEGREGPDHSILHVPLCSYQWTRLYIRGIHHVDPWPDLVCHVTHCVLDRWHWSLDAASENKNKTKMKTLNVIRTESDRERERERCQVIRPASTMVVSQIALQGGLQGGLLEA